MPKVFSIRSCFTAAPGTALIEADYRSAEIYTFGYLSGCLKLVKDADSDLHSRGAVTRMGAPKWDGFEERKKAPGAWRKAWDHLRIASKALLFGIFYQRGPASIAREILDATHGKTACTKASAQGMIDAFFEEYPEGRLYTEFCKRCVVDPGYITNAYGRRRRFYLKEHDERSFKAACERECVNMPIQGSVADTINVALYNLWAWRRYAISPVLYRLMLPVHDAVLSEVPFEHVPGFVDVVLPVCMTERAVVPTWRQAPWPTQQFKLETDIEVSLRWGAKTTVEEFIAAGMDKAMAERFGHKT